MCYSIFIFLFNVLLLTQRIKLSMHALTYIRYPTLLKTIDSLTYYITYPTLLKTAESYIYSMKTN